MTGTPLDDNFADSQNTVPFQSGADNDGTIQGRGIDAELIPYLLAADEDEETEELPNEEPLTAEDSRLEALRALVESSLLSGPDPDLLAELAGEVALDAEELAEQEQNAREEQALSDVKIGELMREFTAFLFARAPEHDFEPSLGRIKQLMEILGDPQNAYPSVHLAGTNGKTSTSRMIDALLGAFDLKVGRFTSPHLRDARERITVEGMPLSPEQFLAAWEDINPYVQMVDEASLANNGPRLSFFELLTAMAYAAFADYPVDVAVIETGLGGTWDATNVVDSGVAVITTISVDHERWLGQTIEEIAAEKAGIIKERTIVVCMKQAPEAEAIIRQRCQETDSVLWMEGEHWAVQSRQPGVGGQLISLTTPAGNYEDLFIPLHGEHQAHNAGAALVATEAMLGGKALPAEIVDLGFQSSRSPGRLEVLRNSPTIVVDSAHNPGGAQALNHAIEEVFHFEFTVGVFSAMKDKQVEEILVEMEPILDELVVTELSGERAMPIDELVQVANDVFGADRVHAEPELPAAIDRAAELVDLTVDPQIAKGIVIFGSVILAGEATILLKPDQPIG